MLALAAAATLTATAGEISLREGWRIQQSGKVAADGAALSLPGASTDGWYDAVVPSTVMGALTRDNGLYADIEAAANYKDADPATFDSSWWYRTEFDLTELKGKYVDLRFEGISYRANVWLNGVRIASADELFGTFRRWGFDITKLAGEHNVLAVEVFRAREGDPNTGYVDWNPRPLDESMGLFREVKVRVSGPVVVENTWVRTDLDTATLKEADLTVETDLTNRSREKVTGTLRGRFEGGTFSQRIILAPGETRRVKLTPGDIRALHVDNPRVWWCVGMGSPELYDLEMEFTAGGAISDTEKITFGIRTIDTYFNDEGYKGYLLNGRPVLIKGAGWTDDIFMRDTPASDERQVRYVKDMNMNTIRFENVWGTTRNVYDMCDRHGIMAMVGWSCQWEWESYLGTPEDDFMSIRTPEDIALVTRYLHDQVLWLRNHPSIIAWYGGSDKLARPELERAYMEMLPEIDNRPYVGSAKAQTSEVTGPSGMKMAGPYEYVGPNYWWVDTEYGGAFGFNTETGPGAQLPVRESLERFIPEDELWPMGPSWSYHCTTSATAMNSLDVMTGVVDAKYGPATDLDDYLRKSDLVSYESTRSMFEAFRANKPRTTGLIQWMLNSAWPSLYWQLYDWYGIPTSSYWAVKRANNPWQLVYNYNDNGVYLVNELPVGAEGMRATVSTYDLASHLLSEQTLVVGAEANSSKRVCEISPAAAPVTLVSLVLYDAAGNRIADNFYTLSSSHDTYNFDDTNWYMTPITKHADFRTLAAMPEANISLETEAKDGKVTVRLENPSPVAAIYITLKLKNAGGEVLPDVYWSDNYVSLMPGERRVIECRVDNPSADMNALSVVASGWNSSAQSYIAPRVVLGYVTSWSEPVPDPALLTHINYAFGLVSETFDGVDVGNPARLRRVVALRGQNPDLKILLSIGGWGAGRFSEMAADEGLRAAFAADCRRVVDEFDLDGIDIDWEYPTSDAAGISASPDDRANFTLLMRDIRAAIGSDKLLTLATVANAGHDYIDFRGIDPYIDLVNMMTYDMDGSGRKHHSGLYRSQLSPDITTHEATLSHLAAGVPLSKLVMGVPFYGRATEKLHGFTNYRRLVTLDDYERRWDDEALAPYMVDPATGEMVAGYDDERSLTIKTDYIRARGLRGIMYWAFDGDDDALTLSRTIYYGLYPERRPIVAVIAPTNATRMRRVTPDAVPCGWADPPEPVSP